MEERDIDFFSQPDFANLFLRAVLAVFILFHGISKIAGGIDYVTWLLEGVGVPQELGYLVYVGEVVAPLLVLFGILTRPAALVIAVNMVIAVLLAHRSLLFTVPNPGDRTLELEEAYFILALVVAIQGAGKYSIGGIASRWN
ncbi:DoxX family protein [Noviherbaspirillum malthae]|jgi:putative oxidoreductase|uniref:DoxX family protein n=1 Tax=Noviherbaspirillum malthae TaxID=1260987 RepID=UPI0018909BD2|nr:DoxX family protein [Noviherbaspirillum malthae]